MLMFIPFTGTEILVALAVSVAVSAASYGLQMLLAPKPPTIVGPQKEDLGAPLTSPGGPIPFAVGRNIARGQIIWTSGIVETKHVEKVKGGKGGGKSQKIETFTYSISMAVAFNDGEIACIHRIRANGSKLIWSRKLGEDLSEAEIQARVDERFDEVYDEEYAFWTGLFDDEGNRIYTDSQADQTATANAQNAADRLEAELESANFDFTQRYASIEIFNGTEDQEPSSLIESFEGVGNVPAFKGTAYFVIQDLELADFGQAVPVLDIDYSAQSSTSTREAFTQGTAVATPSAGVADDKMVYDWTDGVRQAYITGFPASGREIMVFDIDTLEYVRSITTPLSVLNGAAFLIGIDRTTGYLIGNWWSFTTAVEDWVFDPATDTFVTRFGSRDQDDATPGDRSNVTTTDMAVVIRLESDPSNAILFSREFADTRIRAMSFPGLLFQEDFTGPLKTQYNAGPMVECDGFKTYCVFQGFVGTPDYWEVHKFVLGTFGAITRTIFTIDAHAAITSFNLSSLSSYAVTPIYDPIDDALIWTFSGVDADLGTVRYGWVKWKETSGPFGNGSGLEWDSVIGVTANGLTSDYIIPNNRLILQNSQLDLGEVWWLPTTGGAVSFADTAVLKVDLNDGSYVAEDLETQFGVDVNYPVWDEVTGCFYYLDLGTVEPETTAQFKAWCELTDCFDPVTITTVITQYLLWAGYSASEFDIDSYFDTTTIYGFNNNKGRTPREILEDLARIRPVIAFESERKLKFRPADQTPVATISIDDMRAYAGRSAAPEFINEINTLEDLHIPQALQIVYLDIDRLLNPTPVFFKREVTVSETLEEFNVEAVDSSGNMRLSVFNAMSQLMATKRTFKFTLPLKYIGFEPGDVLTVPISDERTADIRVTKIDRGANNLVDVTGVKFIEQDLGFTLEDDFDPLDGDTADLVSPCRLYVIDTPYLTDLPELNAVNLEDRGLYLTVAIDEDSAGANVYADDLTIQTVSDGFSPETFSQPTGDAEWILAAQFTAFTSDGLYVRGLSQAVSADVVDTTSELIVSFRNSNDSFSTLSDNEVLRSQDNVFLIGNEILQAKTVTLLRTDSSGRKTYEFTDLYRGLQGTEWAIGTAPTEGVSNVVHLNPNAIQRFDPNDENLVGLTLTFRGVTVGSDLTVVDDVDHVFQGRSRLPYAPYVGDVSRDPSGNLTFSLITRNRYGDDWEEGGSPTFKSDPDVYEVDIINVGGSPEVVRTLYASGDPDPTFTYTAAQQATDFGSPIPASVTIEPYQLNDDDDRGFTNRETI